MAASTVAEPVSKSCGEVTEESADPPTVHKDLGDLSKFQLERVLSCDSRTKTICVVGDFADEEGKAILFLEKTPLDEDAFKNLCSAQTSMKQTMVNNIYGNYQCFPEQGLNSLKALVIHPATEKHIGKYEPKPVHFINETPHLYQTVTLPQLEKEQFNLDWVFNILDHKAEEDRIVAEDMDPVTGFVLIPDLKWDGTDPKSLYLLALARPRGIKSLRDLTAEHLPLLENILKKGKLAIFEKYGLNSSQLRIYIHYQPSYYHLHVHFTYLQYDAPGVNCGRAHLLTAVINNIKMMPDYYQKATIPFTLNEGNNLFTRYCEQGILEPTPVPKKPAEVEKSVAEKSEKNGKAGQ